MNIETFLKEPLQGKTSLSRVFWLYGVVGSILYGSIELFLNPGKPMGHADLCDRRSSRHGLRHRRHISMRRELQIAGGGADRRAISAVISLLLLPVLAYLDFTGTLTLTDLMGGQLPE